jgi:hypothetical protein
MTKRLMRVVAGASLVAAIVTFAFPVGAADKPDKPKRQQFTGAIETVDATAMTVAVKSHKETKTFTVNDKTKFSTADKEAAALADLKAGDKVVVIYAADGDKMVASKIAPPKPAVKKEKKEK